MKPSLEDFMKSGARWFGKHQGVRYELSWHGYHEEYCPQGTWCWYLHLTDEMFHPDDWAKLRLPHQDRQFYEGGSWSRHYNYDNFPDLEPHGGWTFGEMNVALGRDGKEHEHVKVGCDYNHSWDRDSGYWQGREDVERDAKYAIDLLVKMFPQRRECCGYSAKWDDSENFYTAKNGARVHKSQQDKLREDSGWEHWQPADAA